MKTAARWAAAALALPVEMIAICTLHLGNGAWLLERNVCTITEEDGGLPQWMTQTTEVPDRSARM